MRCILPSSSANLYSSSTWQLYSTSSSRAFCHHLRHLHVAGALSHHWCSGIGNRFWLCQSSRFFFVHTSFSLYEGIQQALSLLVFLHQVLEGDQAITIFGSLRYYSISLHLSFHIILCSLLFLGISHPWVGEVASIEKNQFYLQWFSWWSIIHCYTGKYSGHQLWKDSAWFWWLLCATLVEVLVSSWYWWWGLSYGWCLILCPSGILDICTFSTSLSHLEFWILLFLIHFQSGFIFLAGPGAVSLLGSFWSHQSLWYLCRLHILGQ